MVAALNAASRLIQKSGQNGAKSIILIRLYSSKDKLKQTKKIPSPHTVAGASKSTEVSVSSGKSAPIASSKTLAKEYSHSSSSMSSSPSQPSRCLDKKVAIVTGAAEGIGFAVARALLQNGICGLTIADSNKEKAKEALTKLTSEECGGDESRIHLVDGDMSKSKHFDRAFKETMKTFEYVNVVVNCAGIMNDVNWEHQLTTNLNCSVIGTLLGMQYMSKTCFGQGGIIINVASIMGLIPSSGYPIHTLTQFGIVGFSRAIGGMAHYDRTGVRVAALCPGLTSSKLLKQAPYHAINDKFRNEFKEETGGCAVQRPDSVAVAALDVLEHGLPGSVWVVENNSKTYEIRFPEVADMRFKNKC